MQATRAELEAAQAAVAVYEAHGYPGISLLVQTLLMELYAGNRIPYVTFKVITHGPAVEVGEHSFTETEAILGTEDGLISALDCLIVMSHSIDTIDSRTFVMIDQGVLANADMLKLIAKNGSV